MGRIAPELVVIALGLALFVAGLVVLYGWAVASTVLGALLIVLGAWSAAGRGK